MKRLLLALCALPLLAQDGPSISVGDGPPPFAYQKVFENASPMTYLCWARSYDPNRARTQVAISSVSKASAAVVTSTGHGFPTSARPKVTISGATGTGWTGINAEWTATVTGADTFTIPIDSSGFGTLGGTVVFTTTAPRTSVYEWAVQRFVYSGSTIIWAGWVNGTQALNQRCSDGTSTSINIQ